MIGRILVRASARPPGKDTQATSKDSNHEESDNKESDHNKEEEQDGPEERKGSDRKRKRFSLSAERRGPLD